MSPIHTFQQAEATHRFYRSTGLASALLILVSPKETVIDLGCGDGWYLSQLMNRGQSYILGVEGTPGIERISLIPVQCMVSADLREPLQLPVPAQSVTVLSFEVGEHIEPECADVFFDNLTRYAARVLMSWAEPDPSSDTSGGHVNEQENDWVIAKMLERNFQLDEISTAFLREAVRHCPLGYFKNRLMAFRRGD